MDGEREEDREMIKNYILYSLSFSHIKTQYAFAYTFVIAFSCWID